MRFGRFFVPRRPRAQARVSLPCRHPCPSLRESLQEILTTNKDKTTYVWAARETGIFAGFDTRFPFSTRTCPFDFFENDNSLHLKNIIKIPAATCKIAKMKLTVFTGSLPSSFAPKTPPAVTPIAVGINTEISYSPFHA